MHSHFWKKNLHPADHGWGIPGALDANQIFFKVDKSLHFLWNVKHFSNLLDNIRIGLFEIYGFSHSFQMKNSVV